MRIALLVALTGCSSIFGLHEPTKTGTDAARDSAVPLDGAFCYGTGLFTMCTNEAPAAPLSLSGMVDTRTDSRCVTFAQQSGPPLCVMLGTDIDVSDTVVTGDRPLVLVAANGLVVSGTLDASSVAGVRVGAGANVADCGAMAGGDNTQGGGGGAGGSFGAIGGNGGTGASALAQGGSASAPPALTFVRGGCAGGKGGIGQEADAGGVPGASGGALYLIAGSTIRVTSTGAVFASGGGGGGGNPTLNIDRKGAGGGGGSGGLIGFDAPMIAIDGIVAANGGGGGGGGDAGQGQVGGNGTTRTWDVAAAGGPNEGGQHGAPGGAGGVLTTDAAAGIGLGGCCGGGGGGGGSVGVVYAKGSLAGMMISPAPSTH